MRTRSCGDEHALHELAPARRAPASGRSRPSFCSDLLVEPLLVEAERDLVDRADVGALDDRAEFDVAEERDLALDVVGDRPFGADDEHVRLNSDLHQLAHGVLRRLGLELARRGDVRQQREVDEERVLAADVVAELTDRLEERQRLDVADRAADFDDHDVGLRRRAGASRALISSVMCGITCTVAPRNSPRRSLVMTLR